MNCCNCLCIRQNNRGPVGPRGPAGPAGGSRVANFYSLTSGELTTGEGIPLLDNINLATPYVTHSAGSPDVVLTQAGNYRITYYSNATSTAGGVLSLGVTAGGTTIPQSVSQATEAADDTVSLASSFVYTNPTAGTVLNLANNSAVDTTYTNTNFLVEYITV